MKILLAGWFSFENCGATAGDLMARDVVAGWLASAGIAYDVAGIGPFAADVVWTQVDPAHYTHVIFVCGPVVNKAPGTDFYERFANCKKIGIDVSMVQSLAEYNPFDVLLERDSERGARPDLALAARQHVCPVVGLLLVHPQHEYGKRGKHNQVNEQIKAFLDEQVFAVCPIDTVLQWNPMGFTHTAQVESLIRKMDFVVTTRLHGMVLALKNGIPAVAIDAIAGGAKVTAQAKALDWKWAISADELDAKWLQRACDFCTGPEAPAEVQRVLTHAKTHLQTIEQQLIDSLNTSTVTEGA